MADKKTTAALRRAIKAIEEKSKGLKAPLGTAQSSTEMRWLTGITSSPEAASDLEGTRGSPAATQKSFKQSRLKPKTSNQKAKRQNDGLEETALSEETALRKQTALSKKTAFSHDHDTLTSSSCLLDELDELDDAEIEANARVMLRRSALNLLAQREQTALELKQKLGRRFPEYAPLLDGVIERLQEQGLQNDSRMAEAYVRYRVQRGQGPMKIRSEMIQKGLTGCDIDTAFRRQAPDWIALATAALQKRFGAVDESERLDRKERAKRSRFLQQRGFHYEQISAAL